VPELNRRYAELHERTLDGLASVYARLHERAGTTPRYPVRVLAQLTMAVSRGAFLERLADPAGIGLPTTEVISELVLQAEPGADGEHSYSQSTGESDAR
jgi:hypothetical protein